jgi:hypothetical protein
MLRCASRALRRGDGTRACADVAAEPIDGRATLGARVAKSPLQIGTRFASPRSATLCSREEPEARSVVSFLSRDRAFFSPRRGKAEIVTAFASDDGRGMG